ncbi:MAG TPA: hypothetical protein DIT05_01175 [Morganella sp. (in: Bacteria)]|nr:hypothetical protein [Morganella sp. (in: enterobacteria)]
MINRTFLRWFLTVVLLFAYFIVLALFDLGFSLNFTYNYTVLGADDPVSVWRAFVDRLLVDHNNVMSYVYLGTPILLVLLFVIHKKIR